MKKKTHEMLDILNNEKKEAARSMLPYGPESRQTDGGTSDEKKQKQILGSNDELLERMMETIRVRQ